MCLQKIILLFDGCNVEVICQWIHEKSIAEDEGKTMTLQKITVQRVAFKFCVAEGTFSH